MADESPIHVTREVVAAMRAHALQTEPAECCGLLVGTPHLIDESVPTENLAASPTRFEVDPLEHIRLNRRLRGSGRAVIGAYHSHPHSAAQPSAMDIAEAHYPEFVHIIVSLVGDVAGRVRAYRIRDGRATPLALVQQADSSD
jgi:proteasome lid subunit RPN8/RPN11